MRERLEVVGGNLATQSQARKGTTIIALIPLGNYRGKAGKRNLKDDVHATDNDFETACAAFVIAKFGVWLRKLATQLAPQIPIRSTGLSLAMGVAMMTLGGMALPPRQSSN